MSYPLFAVDSILNSKLRDTRGYDKKSMPHIRKVNRCYLLLNKENARGD